MTMYCPYMTESSAKGRNGNGYTWTNCIGGNCRNWDGKAQDCTRNMEAKARIHALTIDVETLANGIREAGETLKGVIEKMSY